MADRQLPRSPVPGTWDGENYSINGRVWSKPYVSENTSSQSIAATPIGTVVKFGVVTGDSVVDIDFNGIFTVIKGQAGFEVTAELNINNTGGASTVASWTEVSIDGGSTWSVFNTSPKVFTLPSTFDGYVLVAVLLGIRYEDVTCLYVKGHRKLSDYIKGINYW